MLVFNENYESYANVSIRPGRMILKYFFKLAVAQMFVITFSIIIIGCNQGYDGQEEDKSGEVSSSGIGPVSEFTPGEIDMDRAKTGKTLFENKCSACHKMGEKYVGPDLAGVTKRREPAWILNMILNPVEMTKKDPVANELLATHYTQMTQQNVTEDQARDLFEYFRVNDSK